MVLHSRLIITIKHTTVQEFPIFNKAIRSEMVVSNCFFELNQRKHSGFLSSNCPGQLHFFVYIAQRTLHHAHTPGWCTTLNYRLVVTPEDGYRSARCVRSQHSTSGSMTYHYEANAYPWRKERLRLVVHERSERYLRASLQRAHQWIFHLSPSKYDQENHWHCLRVGPKKYMHV